MRLFAGTPWDRPPVCERCGRQEGDCSCGPMVELTALTPPEKQSAKLAVERRKRGKIVTVVRGLSASESDLPALLVRFKNDCGAGGTLDGDALEIQGNHLERLRKLLTEIGYKVRD